ncbi:MAG: phosphoribosylamine--glycine ligase [Candidatus Eremiobacteraeota bacterium]|nr:phosphoribosylamine--glycine ligase [Candidatus Eremiobacteraeota bacterium]MBC5802083.1 phosphoribosylamine--glycine ligase [Candidatus Eremiobacteraeota bacterium]MBC5822808.1 phosphoribosylamine--glycine ligase [Candidatus Eremiobacteraeota bacterium]
MKILVIGNGAREDALSWRLAQSPSCSALYAAPGNAGTAARGTNWNIAATDGKALVARALEEKIDLAVIGPETAIAAGVADRFREARIPVFGPNRSAGRLESSKVFAKRFMERHGIPTARAKVVHSLASARKALGDWSGSCVVKADGLAAGKGVVVAPDAASALTTVQDWYGPGGIPGGGSDVLLEECLHGRELSVFALSDGKAFMPIVAACDYKRAGDGDTGPNTGGMGAYSPPLGFPVDVLRTVEERILGPVARGLAAEGERYVGVLYCGLMWTARGPCVIEFNVRFGDPETQVIMPRVRGDLAASLASAARGALDPGAANFDGDSCVGVVLATVDYPRASTPLQGLCADVALDDGRVAFWGASTIRDGSVTASGGRVLTVTAVGADVANARERAYGAVGELAGRIGKGLPLTYRTDIAAPQEV